jgi:hypothetical protein
MLFASFKTLIIAHYVQSPPRNGVLCGEAGEPQLQPHKTIRAANNNYRPATQPPTTFLRSLLSTFTLRNLM